MSYQTLVGEKRSLVFPVMGYSYLTIDYDREIADRTVEVGDVNSDTTDEVGYSIFGHTDSFTISTILTPYDVNGYKHMFAGTDNPTGVNGIVDSKKTMPHNQLKTISYVNSAGSSANTTDAHHQSYSYFTNNQKTHEMMIFYNTNVQLSLINTTSIEHNQPAEYKIRFTVIADGVSDSLDSGTVITSDVRQVPNSGSVNVLDSYTGKDGTKSYDKINHTVSISSNTLTASGSENQKFIGGGASSYRYGEKLYTVSGQTFTHAGTVDFVDGSGVHLLAGHSITSSEVVYRESPKEALYLVTPYHIAVAFDAVSGKMSITLNNKILTTKTHSAATITDFLFYRENSYIGAKITGTASTDNVATNRKQFMGEIHEFAISDGFVNEFSTIETLVPQFRNLLLYYRFEEIDLK